MPEAALEGRGCCSCPCAGRLWYALVVHLWRALSRAHDTDPHADAWRPDGDAYRNAKHRLLEHNVEVARAQLLTAYVVYLKDKSARGKVASNRQATASRRLHKAVDAHFQAQRALDPQAVRIKVDELDGVLWKPIHHPMCTSIRHRVAVVVGASEEARLRPQLP